MGCAQDTTRARWVRVGEHAVEKPAAMPRFDGVENEFGAVLRANDPCHGGIMLAQGEAVEDKISEGAAVYSTGQRSQRKPMSQNIHS
jgi:hypothetical protein